MKIIPYFLLMDSFGVNINFYLNGNKYYRSHFGGLITLLIYVVTILCGVFFSDELFLKNKPKISTASAINNKPIKIYYPDNIFFMFTLTINSIPFIDEKIYRAIGHIRLKVNGTETLLQKNLSVEICSKVFNESYKYYKVIKHLNLSNYYCISIDPKKNGGIERDELFINEYWGNEGFQMLQIKIYNCTAIAENKSECELDNIIKDKLKSPIISYYTLNNQIDTNNYENPYVRGLEETFYYVSYKKFISVTEYLKLVQIHTDIGYLFHTEVMSEDNTVDSMTEFSENEPEDGKIFTISLQLSDKIEIYSRSYYKIQDLGADIGAIYGALHMVFALLFQFYNTSKFFTNVINKFFLIKEDFKPISREKKAFINLKTKFYNNLKLNISLQGKNTFSLESQEDDYVKTNDPLNNPNIKSNIKSNKFFNLEENKKINIKNEKKINNDDNDKINKKFFYEKIIKRKKEEEKKRIKINFSCIDRFFCLYLIDLCRNRVKRYSYYNLYYKGKDYIIKVLDIDNYLRFNHFLNMFFLINGKEKKELYDYVNTPILSSNYVGPRFEAEI